MRKDIYYAGIDLHRNNFVVHITNGYGESILQKKYIAETKSVDNMLAVIPKRPEVVIEATRNWMWLVGYLKQKGCNVTLAHPLKTKAIASARIKTDKLDAKILCHLLRSGMIPPAYVAPETQQQMRELSRGRIQFVRDQTQIKNRIRALMAKENITFKGDLFGSKGTKWIKEQTLTPARRYMIDILWKQLTHTQECIQTLDKTVKEKAADIPEVDLVMSIPSLGLTTAFTIVSEVGDVRRFPTSGHFTSYLGLVPRLSQSGNHSYYGRITKLGNTYVRWSLVQAAHRLCRMEEKYKKYVTKLSYRAGKKKAIVALSRKLAVIIYHVLHEQRPYIKSSNMA